MTDTHAGRAFLRRRLPQNPVVQFIDTNRPAAFRRLYALAIPPRQRT